ncbi:MAG: DNA cytosine methyltransferase [Chloroflexi bacterium]|nr:DNA cytosine methyltransferase [Nitrososphaera sp.]MCI0727639.1 DNA cytosine methyltransferase [Chloroflexota bacterium]
MAIDIPILSFFTGAGLLDIGFLEAGFRIVWHNECDSDFATGFEYGIESLYKGKYGEAASKVQNQQPIQEVAPGTIEAEAFHNTGSPGCFGIIGGPPCPDFSAAGNHKGKDGTNGYLLGIFVERILSLRPTFFLIENVPGLLKTTKHRMYLAQLLQQLAADYLVDVDVLNALDFGVPQDRNRVFVVGFRRTWLKREKGFLAPEVSSSWEATLETVKEKLTRSRKKQKQQYALPLVWEQKWFPWPRNNQYYGAKTAYEWPTISPFGEEVAKPEDIPDSLMVATYICDVERLAGLPNGNEGFIPHSEKFHTISEGDVSGKSFKRLHRWRYSPPAAYGNNEVHLHPTRPRRLTVREAMLIQSVPDEYALPEDMVLSKKFKTIANGVPVKLAKALGEQIATVLSSEELITSQR